jgi:hypothetical protein
MLQSLSSAAAPNSRLYLCQKIFIRTTILIIIGGGGGGTKLASIPPLSL